MYLTRAGRLSLNRGSAVSSGTDSLYESDERSPLVNAVTLPQY